MAALLEAQQTALYRPALAAIIATGLILIGNTRPRTAVGLTLAFLVWLGLLRRLLIPLAGWSGADPLLLVGPVVATFLAFRMWVRGLPIAPDVPAKLILALLLLAIVEAANPLGGSVLAGIAGLLYMGAPLVWFFVGREIADRTMAWLLLLAVVGFGVAAAVYGIGQATLGLPTWDAAWVQAGGYPALLVGAQMRSFGPFSSSAEYAAFVGAALVIAVAIALHGRLRALLAVPVLATALFFDSTRAALVLAGLAIVVILGLRMPRLRTGLTVVFLLVGSVLMGAVLGGPVIEAGAAASGNALIVHQVAGILHPFDAEQSTLPLHWQLVVNGLTASVQNPLGYGTAVTNLAGGKFGANSAGTQMDVSNAFVSLGVIGGLLFLLAVVVAFWKAIDLYRSSRDVAALGVVGLLIVTLGQWLNGGEYAVAPLLWFFVGWSSGALKSQSPGWSCGRATLDRQEEETERDQVEAVGWHWRPGAP